jgi:hypothetical protein
MLNISSDRNVSDSAIRRDFLKTVPSGIALGEALRAQREASSQSQSAFAQQLQHCQALFVSRTGKTVQKPASTITQSASPEIIGSGEGDARGSGGGDSGSESGGDGDGGEDDPPPAGAFESEEPSRKKKAFLNRLLALINSVLSILLFPLQLLPDFVETMRLFDYVFPDDIYDDYYAPCKLRLLREMCRSRDAEYSEAIGRVLWKGFWRRVRFASLVIKCFLQWIGDFV